MNPSRRATLTRPTALVAAVLGAAALGGCDTTGTTGSSSSTTVSAGATASAGADPAALVPAEVKERGYITVVTDASYPPFGFFEKDGKTLTGIDVDTAAALEPVLGVKVKVVNAGFDAFIPGLQAGRYDAGFNGISDTPERRKVVDFVDFNEYGGLFLTRPDSALKFTGLEVACGVKVGAEKGSDTITFLKDVSTTCQKDGKEPVDLAVFGTQSDALTALTSQRVDAVLGPSTAGYLAERSDGAYVVNGPLQRTQDGKFDVGGLALKKDSPITQAMLAALTTLEEDGTLAEVYEKYGITAESLTTPKVNGG